jgi:hypothetical protein
MTRINIKVATTVSIFLQVMISSPVLAECDESYLKANAIFIRATVACGKNYMDSQAGYYALAMSKKCNDLSERKLNSIIMNAMKEFDKVSKTKGKKSACRWADELEKTVNNDRPN